MRNPTIIGISGRIASGKDTFAKYLMNSASQKGYRVLRRALADQLKEEAAHAIVPSMETNWSFTGYDGRPTVHYHTKLKEVIAEMNDRKEKEKWRLYLQWFGTQFRREMFSQDYWLKALEYWIEENTYNDSIAQQTLVFVPDVRFKNEADFIHKQDGYLINIIRDGRLADNHISENDLEFYSNWDAVIDNNRTLDDLQRAADFTLMDIEAWGGVL